MKIKLILLSLLFGLSLSAQFWPNQLTNTINLAWDPSSFISPGTTNYTLYMGTNSGNYYTNWLVGTNTSYCVSNLVYGYTYYFSVTVVYIYWTTKWANSQKDESHYSNEAIYSYISTIQTLKIH